MIQIIDPYLIKLEKVGTLKKNPVTLIWICLGFFQNGIQIFTRIGVYQEKRENYFGEIFGYILINSSL